MRSFTGILLIFPLVILACNSTHGEGDPIALPSGMEHLSGAWTVEAKRSTLVRMYPNGEIVIDVKGWPEMAGTYTFDSLINNRMRMTTTSNLACTGVTGTYDIRFSLDKQTAFFDLVADDCDMRMRRLRRPLTKVSEDAYVPHPK